MAKVVIGEAVPEDGSVCIVGVCEKCGGSIQAIYAGNRRMFSWFHRVNGKEECNLTRSEGS